MISREHRDAIKLMLDNAPRGREALSALFDQYADALSNGASAEVLNAMKTFDANGFYAAAAAQRAADYVRKLKKEIL